MESNGSVGSPGGGSPARISVSGHSIKHVAAGRSAHFDITAPGHEKEDIQVSILGSGKQSLSYRLNEVSTGVWRVEFTAQEVGNYVIDSSVAGIKPQGAPFITRVYNASLIQVSELPNGVVGQAVQFKVDASQAGEGQLEISINDGEVPNHVQVLGGGRCLVSFTPDSAKTHSIHIKFNGETVPGCPYMCRVTDTSTVRVSLHHLELIPISQLATFNIHVDSSSNAELAVSVRGPGHTALPVKVTGSPRSGFRAEWTPREVGTHSISVDYNGSPVNGTPFISKVYDAKKVYVSSVPKGAIGKSLQFTVDASQAGEGNLEITISAKGRNIPTQVHCQGNARFTVSFVPLEAVDHVITISFNKEAVPGSPFIASVYSDPNLIVVSGHNLATAPVGKPAMFTLSNVTGSVEDIEVNVEGPGGTTVSATVSDAGDNNFSVEYCPRLAGEHKITVLFSNEHVPGSPFICKAYDASNIKVQEANKGVVGKPVTFLVNTSQAGFGNLEVTVNQGQVPTSAQPQGNRTYAISFTPKEAKPHVVELKFNQENVPGSPFTCMVMDASQVSVSGDGLEKVPVGRRTTFFINSLENMADLDVKIIGPTRRSITANMKSVGDGKYQVDYTPQEIGDHSIEVRYLELNVPGSPFLMKAYDPTRIRVTDIKSGQVGKPVYFSIDASQAGAGNLEIIVSVNGKHVPNYVQPEVNAKFRVNFKPQVAADHILSVKFNNEPVPGSPFTCPVTDSSQIIVSDEGLKMSPLTDMVKFSVDTRGADLALCSASVLSPTARSVPVSLQQKSGILHAEFNPAEVGPHTVSVLYDGEPVANSPYTCNIYDVSKVRVTGIGLSKVGQHVTFGVDASEAGEGTLELVVMTRDSTVRAEVTARSRGLYYITFTPQEPVPHMVYITFNENDVPGSPFTCEVRELGARELREIKRSESRLVTARGDGLRESIVGSTASFIVDCKGRDGDVDVRVTGPADNAIPVRVTPMKNGLHRAEYRTDEVGVYHVEVFYRSQSIAPQYLVEVADPSKVKLFDISESFQRREASFKVDTSNAGRGTLLVTVRAPGGQKVKHSVSDLGWGTYQVFFTPLIPVTHRVDVRYSGVPVKGSPLEIPVKNELTGKAITAAGAGLYQSRVSKTTSFVIETMSNPGKDFDVVIEGPGASAVPVKCYQQRDENLLAEFIPQIAGEHKIEVQHNGKAVMGSPYTCHVYDTSRVTVEEPKTNSFVLNQRISLTVEHKNAGQAELDVSVNNPHMKPVPVHVRPLADGSAAVLEFTPTIPGPYKMIVTYGDEEVPGSPFNLIVEEEGAAQVSGEGLSTGLVGQAAMFRIDPVGLAGEPTVHVDGPDSVARSTVTQEADGRWLVTYTPQETGVFDVRVLWNGQELSGSPFHPRVVDPRKVRVIGGWESLWDEHQRVELTVGEEKKINFDIAEAGPGKLTAEVRGPTDILEPTVEAVAPSRCRLAFTPLEEGEHLLALQWGGFSLPQSPVTAYAPAPGSSLDHTRVTLKGHGLTQARCGDEAEFVVNGSEAGPGYPEVSMSGMKADIRVTLQPMGNNVYRAVYTPQVAGAYLLNVTWSQRQVKGCPLKVTVTSVTDASKVLCTGDGLKGGTVGRDIRSFIDTRRAGPGELTAHCVGPHKTAYCELYDHGDGTFTLNVKPQEPGRHALTIKYGGDHVPGSPYTLRISGPPDASKVRVHGPGIEPGVLANFQSRFYCDTRGAGAGQLTVRIRGPKGAFRVEMQRQSQKDRSILCKFDPTEPGDYRVEVKWSGQHVPGSPFMVMIFDTQEELNRYIQGSYAPAVNSPSSEYYGSVGYSTTYGQMSLGQVSWRGSQAQL